MCRKIRFINSAKSRLFAVKKSISVLKSTPFEPLGLTKTGLRYGLQLTVNSPQGPTDILNVHMKSGCFVDDYS
ncbi:hypothetical protein ACOBV8_18450 (plasmid) [Pseudoalteromonas espejiana]